MLIKTINKFNFMLLNNSGNTIGSLNYKLNSYIAADISLENGNKMELISKSKFNSIFSLINNKVEVGKINMSIKNSISLQLEGIYTKYFFKKTGFWKTRFVLFSKEGDEVLALLPAISWKKNSYNFKLQLSEEFSLNKDNLLILLTLHCTIYSLVMMYESVY